MMIKCENAQKIIVSKCIVGGHDVIFMKKENSSECPVIFLYHKLMEWKENELSLGYSLALEGYFIVLFDAPYHGPDARRNKYDFNYILEDIQKNVWFTNEIIQYLKKSDEDLDYKRIGVVGSSIGATTALMSGVLLDDVSFIGCFIGTCNLESVIQRNSLLSYRIFSTTKQVMNQHEVLSKFSTYDVLRYLNPKNMKPIIFLDGLMDMTIPIEEKRKFYEKIINLYRVEGKSSLLCFKQYKFAGHVVTSEMQTDFINWLQEWK